MQRRTAQYAGRPGILRLGPAVAGPARMRHRDAPRDPAACREAAGYLSLLEDGVAVAADCTALVVGVLRVTGAGVGVVRTAMSGVGVAVAADGPVGAIENG